jgi:hypothetical protein
MTDTGDAAVIQTPTDKQTAVPSKDGLLRSLKAIGDQVEKQFTDTRDQLRVQQAQAGLATTAMAVELLHSTVENRKGLKAAHEKEAEAGGHYAIERRQHVQHYEEADLYAHDGA